MHRSENMTEISPSLVALFQKYRQLILYCAFGFGTFLVSMVSYALCFRMLNMHVLVANIISWVFAATFAFFTNRKWVFDGDKDGNKSLLQQMASFFGGRLFTLGVEELILSIFVMRLKFDGVVVKVVAQVVVIVLNYFISKFWVFKKRPDPK